IIMFEYLCNMRALRQALDWYGVPADCAEGPSLTSIPAVQAALDALDVVVGGWLRQDVIKLLNSNYVRPLLEGEFRLSARRLETLALEAGIIGGAFDKQEAVEAWRTGLRQLQQRVAADRHQRLRLERDRELATGADETQRVLEDEDGNRFRALETLDRTVLQLEQAAQVVEELHRLLRPLEEPQSLAEAARAFGTVIETLGLVEAAGRGEAQRVAVDLQGLTQLSDLLRATAETPEVLGLAATGNAAQFAAHLRQACSATRLPGSRHRASGVQVSDLSQAGLERFALVVVCGLRDGVFPARRRQDVFYSDAEREALQAQLPGLRPRLGNQHDDEHLLYGALAAADERVWLSYPLTEANGSPVLRSLYVEEVLRQWQTDEEGNRPAGLVSRRRQSEVILSLPQAAHYLEALEAAQDRRHPAEEETVAVVEGLAPTAGLPTLAQVRALARTEERRGEAEGGGPFAGVLADDGIAAELTEEYGPEHLYSVSQLNTYAGCPMAFFLGRVLGLEAPDEPTEGLDRRDLGTLVHRILANFFAARALGRDGCEPLTPESLPEAQVAMRVCIDQVCDTWAQNVFGAKKVWARAIERLRADLAALLEFEAGQSDPECPSLVRAVEATFGNGGSFAITPPSGEPIRLRGRMDRVDLADQDGERRWVLWDYKTNNGVGKKLVEQGLNLQLAVYAMAVEELFPGEAVGSGLWGYYRVARPVGWPSRLRREAAGEGPDNLEAAVATAKAKIIAHVAAIRAGHFELTPNEALAPCRFCDFRGTCRVE
ncbi:MAG: PD-(D/E)XK nuclease family protein, partial [Armatimonadota bacterium]